jgi:hypothetical protein
MALSSERRFEEAIALCLQTIPRPESSLLASLFLGYASFQLGRLPEAENHLKSALALGPSDYYANLFFARTLERRGRLREALGHYTTCCQADAPGVAEPFEAGMNVGSGLRDTDEGVAFALRYEQLRREGHIPDPLAARFLFLWHRDADLTALLSHADGPEEQRASIRYIHSVEDWASRCTGTYLRLGDPETIRIVRPSEDYFRNPQVTEVTAARPYVAVVEDATIIGNSSLVHVGDSGVLSDVLAEPTYGPQVSMAYDKTVLAQRPDALLLAATGTPEFLQEGVMLSGLASNAFGHWFAEFLPKLRHFVRHPKFASLPLIVDAGMPRSHFDFLAALVPNRLHRIETGRALMVRQLYLAPTTTFFPVELVPDHTVPADHQASWTAEAMRFIKERVDDGKMLTGHPSRRIFLSRKKSTWRLLRNEGEVIEALRPLGFETVFMEELDFAQQVQTFREAEFIVAPNGSALNGLIFAAPKVKALILQQQNSFNWGGWLGPILDLGFHPEFLDGEALAGTDFKHSDYVVSTPKVLARVWDMLSN